MDQLFPHDLNMTILDEVDEVGMMDLSQVLQTVPTNVVPPSDFVIPNRLSYPIMPRDVMGLELVQSPMVKRPRIEDIPHEPQLPKRRRKRGTFHRRVLKPVVGNNHSGRTGVPACAQCRLRRSKCTYIHVDAPCRYCLSNNISEPCVKLLGPKAQARIVNSQHIQDTVPQSRPLTRYDPSIPSKHIHIFEYLFFEDNNWDTEIFRKFIRTLTSMYALSVDHTGLRAAMLSYIIQATGIPTVEQYEKTEIYNNACSALIEKLDDIHRLDESDLYASYFIAVARLEAATKENVLLSESESRICLSNVEGCLAVAEALYNQEYESRRRDKIPATWYFVRSSLLRWVDILQKSSGSDIQVDFISLGFREMLGLESVGQMACFSKLLGASRGDYFYRSTLALTETKSAIIRTADELFDRISSMSLSGLSNSLPELPSDFRLSLDQIQKDYTLYVPAELDFACRHLEAPLGVGDAETQSFTRRNAETAPTVLMSLVVVNIACLLSSFWAVLLSAPSLIEGLTSVEAVEIGHEILTWFRAVGGALCIPYDMGSNFITLGGWEGPEQWAQIVQPAGHYYLLISGWSLYEDASDVPPPKSGFEDLFIKCGRDVDTFFKVYFHPFNPVVQSYLEDEEKSGFAEFVKGFYEDGKDPTLYY